jgi:hypothetical protein
MLRKASVVSGQTVILRGGVARRFPPAPNPGADRRIFTLGGRILDPRKLCRASSGQDSFFGDRSTPLPRSLGEGSTAVARNEQKGRRGRGPPRRRRGVHAALSLATGRNSETSWPPSQKNSHGPSLRPLPALRSRSFARSVSPSRRWTALGDWLSARLPVLRLRTEPLFSPSPRGMSGEGARSRAGRCQGTGIPAACISRASFQMNTWKPSCLSRSTASCDSLVLMPLVLWCRV